VPDAVDQLGLRGRRVLVAGAGGLGGACARAFAASGADVFVIDQSSERVATLVDELRTFDGAAVNGAVVDLRKRDDCRAAVDHALREFGGLDIFLHAVGVNDRRPILEMEEDDWDRVLSINLASAFYLGQAVGASMVRSGGGRVIFISSVAGLLGHANHGPYAASKGGLNQLLRVMAREWARAGVTVNGVAPGYVESDLTRDYLDTENHRAELEALVPFARLGTPEEVAGSVLFLASSLAGFVTGQILYVDGGRTLV
jgi:gluconate 5-dehydrogenase